MEFVYQDDIPRRDNRINVIDRTHYRDRQEESENHVFHLCEPSTPAKPVLERESSTCSGHTRDKGCLYGKFITSEEMLKIKSYACILENCFDRFCQPCGMIYLKTRQ